MAIGRPRPPWSRWRTAPVWLAAALLLTWPVTAAAQHPVVAVLSSRLGPYEEALAGFQQEMKATVPAAVTAESNALITSSTRVVVAFGGRAAIAPYPERAGLVYCLAPSVYVDPKGRRAPSARVFMLPRPETVLSQLTEIQPGLRRLGVLWASEGSGLYVRKLVDAARAMGIGVEEIRVTGSDDVPAALRRLMRRRPEALWIPPDPMLVTTETFPVLRDVSRASRLPLYVSSDGLVERGAFASVTARYHEIGRTAGLAARALADGRVRDGEFYPDSFQISVNLAVAQEFGLTLSQSVVRRITRQVP